MARYQNLTSCLQFLALLTLAGLLAGCNGETGETKPSSGESAATDDGDGVKRIDVNALPPTEGVLPPLDDDRIELAPPAGWTVLPRKREYVCRFNKGSTTGPPRILVTAEDLVDTFGTANGGATDPLLAKVTEIAQEELLANEEFAEKPKVLLFGQMPWIRYVRDGAYNNLPVDRQFLRTIVNDRLYTVELQVYHGDLLVHRDHAYTVAAQAKFPKQSAAALPANRALPASRALPVSWARRMNRTTGRLDPRPN